MFRNFTIGFLLALVLNLLQLEYLSLNVGFATRT